MESFSAKLLLLIVGAVIAEVIRQVVEYIKRITPTIEYNLSSGIPVIVGEKTYCAYMLTVSNPSKRKVEDVTIHVRSRNDNLTLEVISKPDGFEYGSKDNDHGIDLSFPYLKSGEVVVARAQAENKYYFSESLSVSVSSPNDIKDKRITSDNAANPSILRTLGVFFSGSVIAVFVVFIVAMIKANQPQTQPPVYEMDRRDVVISAASVVGLPHMAELYLTAFDPKYFNEGDIAYSLAVATGKPDEIEKYRKLLSLTLGTEKAMAPESQANLYYSLGKLDLLISDQNSALKDFKEAIVLSKSIVEDQAKADTKTHAYLVARGLL